LEATRDFDLESWEEYEQFCKDSRGNSH
jgi:hypothetical protein